MARKSINHPAEERNCLGISRRLFAREAVLIVDVGGNPVVTHRLKAVMTRSVVTRMLARPEATAPGRAIGGRSIGVAADDLAAGDRRQLLVNSYL
jgi:hypothetical protein